MNDIFAEDAIQGVTARAGVSPAPIRPDTPWVVARARFRELLRDRSARFELAVTLVLFLIVFGPGVVMWLRRWTQEASPQGYAFWVLPLTLAWCWLNRFRLAVPEAEPLLAQFNNESVVRILTEEEPERPKRLIGPLVGGFLLTALASWTGDALLTGMAFVLTLAGVVAFRHGTLALRAAAFPIAFLCVMLPIPGAILDIFERKLQYTLLGFVTSIWKFMGLAAEQEVEGNPVYLPPQNPVYTVYAGVVGSGLSEVILTLLLSAWYLSMVQGPFRRKFATMVIGVVLMGVLAIARLAVVGWLGAALGEKDLAEITALVTRLLLVAGGFACIAGIGRLLGCREFQPWVSA